MDIDQPDADEGKAADDAEVKGSQDVLQPDHHTGEQGAVDDVGNGVPAMPPLPSDGDVDCYSKPGTRFHRKRSILCLDEHGTVIREKKRRYTTFDRALDEKLRLQPHWMTTYRTWLRSSTRCRPCHLQNTYRTPPKWKLSRG